MYNKEKIDYRIIRGHVRECAVDQHGSRYIQQTLEETKDEDSQMAGPYMMMTESEESLENQPFKDLVFHEVIPHLHPLINDVFGNYVIQKLLEFGSVQMRATIADQILGYMLKLTKNKYGCRVIQKAFEFTDADQRHLLVSELRNQNVLELIKDQNANHVIQKCLESLSSAQTNFIVKAVNSKLDLLSSHMYGCRVLQKILENMCYKDSRKIVEHITHPNNFHTLILDQFGNYLIQTIM